MNEGFRRFTWLGSTLDLRSMSGEYRGSGGSQLVLLVESLVSPQLITSAPIHRLRHGYPLTIRTQAAFSRG